MSSFTRSFRLIPALFAIAALAFAAGESARAQGLTWESVIVREGKSDTMRSTSHYMPGKFRESGSAGDKTVIVRLDKRLFLVLDDGKKEYSEMTFDQMEGMMKKVGGKMEEAMAEMEKQMASLTPEQQKMMKEMMGGKLPGVAAKGKLDVRKGGETKSIGGYACARYAVTRDGEEFMTLWTTTGITGVAAMGEEMKEFGKRMAALNPMGDKTETEAMFAVDGFPMQTSAAGVTTTVTAVKEGAVPATMFDVPAGYKKVKSEFLEGMEGQE